MPNRKKSYADMEKYRRTCKAQKKRYYKKTAIYSGRPWTEEENKKVLAHSITDHELSSEIMRSVNAIQVQRTKLKKKEQTF